MENLENLTLYINIQTSFKKNKGLNIFFVEARGIEPLFWEPCLSGETSPYSTITGKILFGESLRIKSHVLPLDDASITNNQ